MSRKSPFPRREVEKLVSLLERDQNCKIKKTSKGYWVGFPSGKSAMIHLSVSDHRAVKNIRADIERGGCTWPL
jgi:hypothetical protein